MAGTPNKRQKRIEKREKHQGSLPQKKYYRQRAHANPFSDHDLIYPPSPSQMDWSEHYPAFMTPAAPQDQAYDDGIIHSETQIPQLSKPISILDIGCGYGGLLFALAPKMPSTLLLGLEIRSAVTQYVHEKIQALRSQNQNQNQPISNSGQPPAFDSSSPTSQQKYDNISVLRTNSMKFLPNLLPPSTLSKIFLCFPDPHFKTRKHKARIVSPSLASEYAYLLTPHTGKIYTITDVEALHDWMSGHLDAHPSFERAGEEVGGDECVSVMKTETEEGKKVERNGGRKFVGVWRRVGDPPWPQKA